MHFLNRLNWFLRNLVTADNEWNARTLAKLLMKSNSFLPASSNQPPKALQHKWIAFSKPCNSWRWKCFQWKERLEGKVTGVSGGGQLSWGGASTRSWGSAQKTGRGAKTSQGEWSWADSTARHCGNSVFTIAYVRLLIASEFRGGPQLLVHRVIDCWLVELLNARISGLRNTRRIWDNF